MKSFKKLFIVPILLVTLVGCGKVATLSDGEDAVVTLNDGGISANTLYGKLKDKYGAAEVLDLIDNEILTTKYKDKDKETKEYVNEQVQSFKTTAAESNISLSQLLSYYGFADEASFRATITLSYLRDLAVKDYLKDTIKDKEIENYYEKEVYGDIKLQHILIKPETTEEMSTEETEKAEKKAKEKAESIIKELDNGAKFEDLAKKYSDDSTNAENGGDLGWVAIGDMVEEFETASFKLAKGKYTASPIKTTYGYHIIYKTDEKEKPSLKSMKDKIIETLIDEKLDNEPTLQLETLEKIRKDAGLKFEDSEIKKAYDTYIATQKKNASTSTN